MCGNETSVSFVNYVKTFMPPLALKATIEPTTPAVLFNLLDVVDNNVSVLKVIVRAYESNVVGKF